MIAVAVNVTMVFKDLSTYFLKIVFDRTYEKKLISRLLLMSSVQIISLCANLFGSKKTKKYIDNCQKLI